MVVDGVRVGRLEPGVITVIVEVAWVRGSHDDALRDMSHHRIALITRISMEGHHQREVPDGGCGSEEDR